MRDDIAARGTAAQRGYDADWYRLRNAFIRANPLCVMCGKPATEVDHIKPIATAPDLRLDWGNLQSLCHSCHVKKTHQDNRPY